MCPDTGVRTVPARIDQTADVVLQIRDQVLRIPRRVRAENPGDLDSPLHIHVKVVEGEAETAEQKPGQPKLAPATSKRLATARPAAGRDTRHLFAYV